MFLRMQNRGQKIRLNLFLQNWSIKGASSFNVIAEVKGSVHPEEIIVLGGHFDSWDVGSQTGANDDGGGVITCFEAIRLIGQLNLNPKRTIRFIAWSGEEYGGSNSGAAQYARDHAAELQNHIAAFESDLGSTTPIGWGFNGGVQATAYFHNLVDTYFTPVYNITQVWEGQGESVDSGYIGAAGVPTIRNIVDDDTTNEFYFTYHHSGGDSMTMMDPDDMDKNVVGIASLMFLLADAETPLPKN